MSNLSSNLLGLCPLGKKNCPYADPYCSDCIKYEKTEQKRQHKKGGASNDSKQSSAQSSSKVR